VSFVGGDRREPLGGDFGEPFAGEDEERREAGGVPEDGWLNSAPAVLFGLGVERDVVFAREVRNMEHDKEMKSVPKYARKHRTLR
jgi:hypothetical protein